MSGWESDGDPLFDTTVLMPMKGWSYDHPKLGAATIAAQLWGDKIAANKAKFTGKELPKGIAVGLNGHRGDKVRGSGTANINLADYFGAPKEFSKFLRKRGLDSVVVVLENYVKNPDVVNELSLLTLVKGEGGSTSLRAANIDLFEYLLKLMERGIKVRVFSGEQRVMNSGKFNQIDFVGA